MLAEPFMFIFLNFVSPTGEHFLSCKEAAAFLKSYFEGREKQLMAQNTATGLPIHNVGFESVSTFL